MTGGGRRYQCCYAVAGGITAAKWWLAVAGGITAARWRLFFVDMCAVLMTGPGTESRVPPGPGKHLISGLSLAS